MTGGYTSWVGAIVRLPLTADTGPDPVVGVLVLVTLVSATVLSLYLMARLYRGYRRDGEGGMLVLGAGLVLLTTVPIVLRLVLANVPGVGVELQELLATVSQLLGLLIILGVIYDPE